MNNLIKLDSYRQRKNSELENFIKDNNLSDDEIFILVSSGGLNSLKEEISNIIKIYSESFEKEKDNYKFQIHRVYNDHLFILYENQELMIAEHSLQIEVGNLTSLAVSLLSDKYSTIYDLKFTSMFRHSTFNRLLQNNLF